MGTGDVEPASMHEDKDRFLCIVAGALRPDVECEAVFTLVIAGMSREG